MWNKKNIIFIILAILVLVATVYMLSRSYSIYGNRIGIIMIGNQKFQIEIVSTPEKMQKGLSGRNDLCRSCGMLFQFSQPGKYSFWMKDMRFPLDIVWLSGNKVVHIEKNVPADFSGILTSPTEADQVLEINAGSADKLGLKLGDTVGFDK